MSDPIFYLNGLAVPAGDVKRWPSLFESVSYDSMFNVPDNYSIELNNTVKTKYDPKYAGSILYGTKVLKLPVSVFDVDLNQTVMRGVIKNVSTTDDIITIECTSQLSALAELDAEIVETGYTPAQIIYKMLTAPKSLGDITPLIDPSYIDMTSYRFAHSHQAQNRCYVDIAVYKGGEDKKKYTDIITELNKIGHMNLYSHYDKIYFWQYVTDNTPSIIISSIISGTYKDTYSQDEEYKIKNSCSIVYKNGASVAYYEAKDMDSIDKYGESIFGIPTDDVDSDASTDFAAIIDNVNGAKWCGDTAISRLKTPALMCEFSVEYKYTPVVKVGDVIGLNFGAFVGLNTPVRILEADYDRGERRINLKCLFV